MDFSSMYPTLLGRGGTNFAGAVSPRVPVVQKLLDPRADAGDGTAPSLVYKLLANALVGWLKSNWSLVGHVGF